MKSKLMELLMREQNFDLTQNYSYRIRHLRTLTAFFKILAALLDYFGKRQYVSQQSYIVDWLLYCADALCCLSLSQL